MPTGNGTYEQRKKNVWRVRFNIGQNPETGCYDYSRSITVHGTKKTAIEEGLKFRRQLEIEAGELPCDLTVGEYVQSWHTKRQMLKVVKPSTIERDNPVIKRIVAFFGTVPLAELDASIIKDTYAHALDKGKMTASQHHMIQQKLKQILDDAVGEGLIVANPAMNKTIRAPRPKCTSRNSLTKIEAARLNSLVNIGQPESRRIAIVIGLATGLRRGEVLGLQWKHINLDAKKTLRVEQQLAKKANGYEQPKADSYRTIALDTATTNRLSEWKAVQREQLRELGILQDENTPVVTDRDGEIHDPDNYGFWFRDFCVANGFGDYVDKDGKILPKQEFNENGMAVDTDGKPYSRMNRKQQIERHYKGLKFHELRHTCATLLIGNKVDVITVQRRLGHSKPSTTTDIYGHAIEENNREAADMMAALLAS
jgi:integrase